MPINCILELLGKIKELKGREVVVEVSFKKKLLVQREKLLFVGLLDFYSKEIVKIQLLS